MESKIEALLNHGNAYRAQRKPGITEEDQKNSYAHNFLEEPQVAKKLPSDPTVASWLPAAPPKSRVHKNRRRAKSMIQI